LSLIYAGLASLMLSLVYFLPIFEQIKQTKFKLTSPLVNTSQKSLSVKELFSWSAHNDLYIQNIGLIMLIVAILVPFIIWKIKNKAVRDFTIIGEIFV